MKKSQLAILCNCFTLALSAAQQPNIVFLLADDLGYNDVSWHNPDVISPNLEALALGGIRLENYYVQSLCTPSRAALMTGYYPIRSGRQFDVLRHQEPKGLYTNYTLMPEFMKRLGYRSHIVGKWHLGFCHEDYLPTRRGFDSFHGYYTSATDYYNHTTLPKAGTVGYDFRSNDEVDWSAHGTYSSYLFAQRAKEVIFDHAVNYPDRPLFLYFPMQSVHSPVQEAPEEFANLYPDVENDARRTFSGMVTAMDDAIGQVVDALKESGMYENTLIIFSSDNGGNTKEGGNNFPLRGGKRGLYEGGTRSPAFVHAPFLDTPEGGSVYDGLIHITDWLPTLYFASGGDTTDLSSDLDGIDQWDSITNLKPSGRLEMLYNIWPWDKVSNGEEVGPGAALRVGSMKLICGDAGPVRDWVTPDNVTSSSASSSTMILSRTDQSLKESTKAVSLSQSCRINRLPVQLFDLSSDPNEHYNIAEDNPELVETLLLRLAEYEGVMIRPHAAEPVEEGSPDRFGGVFSTGWCQSEP